MLIATTESEGITCRGLNEMNSIRNMLRAQKS